MPSNDDISPVIRARSLSAYTPARLARLRSAMESAGLDAVVLYASGAAESAGHVRYLAGWMPLATEAVIVVPREKEPSLVSNDKNRARAFRAVLGDCLQVIKSRDLWSDVGQVLCSIGSDARIGTVGTGDLAVAAGARLDALLAGRGIPADQLLLNLRAARTEEEAAGQRAATAVADAMVARAMEVAATPGARGVDIMAEVEAQGRRLGADLAKCWLAIGRAPEETYFETFELVDRVRLGDRVQIGTTMMLGGYYSQVLRIGVLGDPPQALQEMADRLIEMQDAALAAMQVGSPVTVIGNVLESMIDATCPHNRQDDPFRFQSCHALGNSYSEPWSAAFLNADRDRTHDHRAPMIQPFQTFEIHPNFTIPGLGHVCAGDVAAVGADGGATWISTMPRGLIQLN